MLIGYRHLTKKVTDITAAVWYEYLSILSLLF